LSIKYYWENFMKTLRPDNTINLLSREDNLYPKGKKTFRVSKLIIYLFIIIAFSVLFFSRQITFSSDSSTVHKSWNFFQQLPFLSPKSYSLKGLKDDRLNVLLLGMGGVKHEGPYLTDTIILASFKPSTKQLALLSIPRDLLVNIPGYGWWKINNANHFGEKSGQGPALAAKVVSEITGQPIPYYFRVDFVAFEKIIDEIGGIKINVEKGFTDYQYPTPDSKYQVVSFEPGWQTMDGATALKYVRSRHGNNGQGSDFSRSQRQQQLLLALKNRVLSLQILFHPKKISNILKTLDKHISTNLTVPQMLKIFQMVKDVDNNYITSKVIKDGPNGLVYPNIINNAYVLQPKAGNWSDIQLLAANIFNPQFTITPGTSAKYKKFVKQASKKSSIKQGDTAQTKTDTTIPSNSTKVEIRNGTLINGLAARTKQRLIKKGLDIIQIGNAVQQDYEQGIIFLLNEQKKDALKIIQNELQLKLKAANDIPQTLKNLIDPQADILIILGKNNSDLEI